MTQGRDHDPDLVGVGVMDVRADAAVSVPVLHMEVASVRAVVPMRDLVAEVAFQQGLDALNHGLVMLICSGPVRAWSGQIQPLPGSPRSVA